jgi:hypothetical protein
LIQQNELTQFDSLGKILSQTTVPEDCIFIRAANGRFLVGKTPIGSEQAMWSVQAGQAAEPFNFYSSDGHPMTFRWNLDFAVPIFPDREGRLWVFHDQQLLLFDSKGKLLYDFTAKYEELQLDATISILFDNNNTAWIGSSNGLYAISIRKNLFSNKLITKDVLDTRGIVQDQKGNLYFMQQGKIWVDSGSGPSNQLDLTAWLAAARDRNGTLWFGDYKYQVHSYEPDSGEKKTFTVGIAGTNQDNPSLTIFPAKFDQYISCVTFPPIRTANRPEATMRLLSFL